MATVQIRKMTKADRVVVSELIHFSTNHWYQTHGRSAVFSGAPALTEVFFNVYEALDPGCGIVAIHPNGRLIGSCFYHPRETHVSLGIMNSHPSYGGCGVARALLDWIIRFADREGKPVRLVSSALNLDSFSLYTRAGFVPRCAYQDMFLPVPKSGLKGRPRGVKRVRRARLDDVPAIGQLEMELTGIQRKKDYRYFIKNQAGFWHASVVEGKGGRIDGFCASSASLGFNMVGPGFARGPQEAASLLWTELDRYRGRTPVFLVPVDCSPLVQTAYAWSARNCELHFSQVRGAFQPFRGVNLPTFLPETA
ncbi:MAG: GNAT family N-acetyltransferase [Verrucomicrobia bacterium]|nr:GNAT family N-acetyltransferase [Verrucomicrobiota bacterium]